MVTANGGVELAVPAGSYRVAAESGNGERNIGVENDPSGDHRLTVTTSTRRHRQVLLIPALPSVSERTGAARRNRMTARGSGR